VDVWRTLIGRAVSRLEAAGLTPDDWRWGGGTVLALRHHHRHSRDIDIFLEDVQYLTRLSPRLANGHDDGLRAYAEAGNHVRLEYSGGEVDFLIVAPVFPEVASERRNVTEAGGSIQLLADKEILGQKLYYRAAGFTGRDLYDFVAVTDNVPELLSDAGLLGIARMRADALTAALASPACAVAYTHIDRPTKNVPFEQARQKLLEWIERP